MHLDRKCRWKKALVRKILTFSTLNSLAFGAKTFTFGFFFCIEEDFKDYTNYLLFTYKLL